MIRIVMDTLGGDNSPRANVEGAVDALRSHPDLYIIFTGDEAAITACLAELDFRDTTRYGIVHAPEEITGEDVPTDAIRLKKNSSMMTAVRLLREDDTLAGMVSTGSTGALVAAGTLRVGRLEGVIRPTLCPVLPSMTGGLVGVCDSGANVDCTSDQLVQFAIMGSLYMESTFGISSPRVGLLNVGTESEKGDALRKETYKRLSELKGINFQGNMESRELLADKFDLVVCDGFSGNVLIKSVEGTALQLLKRIKRDIYSKNRYKFGALFMKQMFREEKEFMNYQNYGGSVLIGARKMMVKGHGSSDARGVSVCIGQALRMAESGLNAKIEASIAEFFDA